MDTNIPRVEEFLHTPPTEKVGDILEQGLVPPAQRGDAGDLVKDRVGNNVLYFFHPEELPEWTLHGAAGSEGYLSNLVLRCEVPWEDLYVAEWGSSVEDASIDLIEELASQRSNFHRYEDWVGGEEVDYPAKMFMYQGSIPPENLHLKKYPSESASGPRLAELEYWNL